MPKRQLFALLIFGLAIAASSLPGAARAAGFNQFVIFGDSTLDTGWFANTTTGNATFQQYLHTAMQNGNSGGWAGNGTMNTTILGDKFGLSAAPANQPGGTGSNYANGGATTFNNNGAFVPDNVFTVQQMENYLASVNNHANPNALYLVKTGDNDATWVTGQGQPWINQNGATYLDQVAANMAAEVAKLQSKGARTIVVRNSYDSALFAGPGGSISNSDSAAAYARTKALDTAEWSDLVALGVHFVPADNDSLFTFVAHNPRLFGFNSWTVQSGNAPNANPHVPAILDILTPEQQEDYLFIDGIHLTTAGQTIEADYTYSLLVAPSEISLLAESVVQSGWARAATIRGQIDASEMHRGPCGVNAWTSIGTYSMEVKNAPGFSDDSGTPYGGTVGMDYLLPCGVIAGVAFTVDSQSPGFSTGGHYNQVEEAPSFYCAYADGPWWGNAVATLDLVHDQISRPVQLGMFTDQNDGSTTGQSIALALRGGCDMGVGGFTTGPVVGVEMQEVHIYGFAETGASGVTALAFETQTRESFVSQLGWRVCTDIGAFHPFAEVDWDHECAGKNRMVTASLTSVLAPYYSLDAVPIASDWATASLGAFYKVSPGVILRGAASAMFIDPQMTTVGGDFGLNVSF